MINFLLYLIFALIAGAAGWALRGREGYALTLTRRWMYSSSAVALLAALADEKFSLWVPLAGGGVILFFLVGPAVWAWNAFFGGGAEDDADHLRGASVRDSRAVSRQLKGVQSRFDIGGVPVPVELETRNFLLAGSPGTGKSQALTRALDALRADGARAVVADASGIYLSRYYNRGDVILNPFDSRSVKWSPLAEIEGAADIPALVKSLIPDAEGEARVWAGYSQTALDAILEHCFHQGLNNGEIFRLAAIADLPELREIFLGTPAQPLVAEDNEKMWGSVRGSLTDALHAIRYLPPETGADGFSIRRHIMGEQPGWIFLSYQQQHRAALSRMIGAAVDIASRAVLSLRPDLERRVIFALDELPLLGKVGSLVDLLTNGRKHGAMVFAGLQTVAQLRESYGRETSQTLLSCLGSWLVLRVADAETAEYMSKYLGEEEKSRIVESGGESSSGFFDKSSSENWQQQIIKDRIVMPSELQNLRDLTGYFNLVGPVPTARVNLELAERREEIAPAFVVSPPRPRLQKQQARQAEQAAQVEENDLPLSAAEDLI